MKEAFHRGALDYVTPQIDAFARAFPPRGYNQILPITPGMLGVGFPPFASGARAGRGAARRARWASARRLE